MMSSHDHIEHRHVVLADLPLLSWVGLLHLSLLPPAPPPAQIHVSLEDIPHVGLAYGELLGIYKLSISSGSNVLSLRVCRFH
jgi:hypothetical protein